MRKEHYDERVEKDDEFKNENRENLENCLWTCMLVGFEPGDHCSSGEQARESVLKMERKLLKIDLNARSKKACAVVCCVLIMLVGSIQVQKVSGDANPIILLSPSGVVKLLEGQNLTLTVNLTNDLDLFTWEVAMLYNGSVLNISSVNIPDNSVFAGHTFAPGAEPKDKEASGDFKYHLNWTMVGATLLGSDTVSVTNGILFEITFTAMATGVAEIKLVTEKDPIHTSQLGTSADATFYSFVLDSYLTEYNDFLTFECDAVVGNAVVNIPPQARFTVAPVFPDNKTNLVLGGLLSGGAVTAGNPFFTFVDFPTQFNATNSRAITGTIIEYIWDFGDGNVTTVNATGPDSAIITHTYTAIGSTYAVSLIVESSGVPAEDLPPLNSTSYTAAGAVGIVLPLFDWTPIVYAVFIILAALIVLTVLISVVRRVRRTRALKALEKPTVAGAGLQPPRA